MKNKILSILFVSTLLLCGCNKGGEQTPPTPPSETYYGVTYLANGGSGDTFSESIKENSEYTIKDFMYTAPADKEFNSWVIDNVTYQPKDKITVTKDIDIIATYKDKSSPKSYTVSYNSNGGTGVMNPVEVEEGLYTLPSCTFTAPSNKTFDYWSISTGSTHYQAGQQINVTSNVTVSANWKNITPNKYTVSYNSNGGSGSIPSVTVDENTWIYLEYNSFTAPSNKEFDCWTINNSSYSEHQAYKVVSNVTVYAKWKDKEDIPPEVDWEDDKVMLECGFYNMGVPLNEDDPIEIKTTLSADASSWFNTAFDGDVDNNYRYIYKNSCSDGPKGHKCSVQAYANGSLKVTSAGLGFGSPYFTHTGAKLEFRIGINGVYNNSEKPDKGKDTFHIYMFGDNNVYLGKAVIKEGTVSTSTNELKAYYTESNCVNVRYFEFRCNALPYKSSQCYNVGINYCNVKSWERA